MRQRSWEDKSDDLDEPVTITEKELRSLKLGARAGLFALILSLIAAGAAGWTVYQGMKPAPVQPETAATQPPAVADSANTKPASMTPEPTAPATPVPTEASAPVPTPVAEAKPAVATRHTVKVVNASSVGHARYGKASAPAHHSGPAPKMESFAPPEPAAPSGIPTPSPIVPTAPVKSAPADSSHH